MTNTQTDRHKKEGERPGTSKETEVPGVKGGERPGTSKEMKVPGVKGGERPGTSKETEVPGVKNTLLTILQPTMVSC